MLKKSLVLAAAALFSMNASAGYIQYRLTGGLVDYDGQATVVIDDTDKSVVFYRLNYFHMQYRDERYHRSNIYSATTSFTGMGPTNMLLIDEYIEDNKAIGRILFSEGDESRPGTFNYTASVEIGPGSYSSWPPGYSVAPRTFTGYAYEVPLNQSVIDSVMGPNAYYEPLRRMVPYYDPTSVPEPASLALFAIGAIGAVGVARRRKAA